LAILIDILSQSLLDVLELLNHELTIEHLGNRRSPLRHRSLPCAARLAAAAPPMPALRSAIGPAFGGRRRSRLPMTGPRRRTSCNLIIATIAPMPAVLCNALHTGSADRRIRHRVEPRSDGGLRRAATFSCNRRASSRTPLAA